MKERINLLIKALGLSLRNFSLRIGKSEAFARSIKNSIGSDVISNILREFPNVNAHWLITGEGEMFIKKEGEYKINNNSSMVGADGTTYGNEYIEKYIQQLEEENKRLANQVQTLQKIVSDNQEIIKGFMDGNITKL